MNILLNGAIDFSQDHEDNSVSLSVGGFPSKAFLSDGMIVQSSLGNGGSISCQRVSDAPPGASHSMKATIGTGTSSVSPSDQLVFRFPIDAIDALDLAMGTASALASSIGIWVKSSITGTFGISLTNHDGSSTIVETITIVAANTWELKTITNIPGRTSGTWNTSGLWGYVGVAIGLGSNNETTTANTWGAGPAYGTTGQTSSHLTTSGSTFQIALANMNSGATANAFAHDPHEIVRVIKRFRKTYPQGTVPGTVTDAGCRYAYNQISGDAGFGVSEPWDIPMSSAPTTTYYSPKTGASGKLSDNAAGVDVTVSPFRSDTTGHSFSAFNMASGWAAAWHSTHDCRLS